ncbi:MAG: EAL domain-containing protein [Oscillatoriophycideae cyanobacterium NC_groundwater_1537_Pr4_S-0.65um_50_18]|nr:EAL domain-containing protein [Oscillatoriophycideae cyanobacterium NC_groundwater_1537_Pr4_S-0.65um_50_18]
MNLYPKLDLYAFLDRFDLLRKSYIAKIMAVAFLGTHIPLLALLLSFLVSNTNSGKATIQVLGIALFATLAGTAATLYALHRLLSPVIVTSTALQDYLNTEALPELPTEFTDEVGTLMTNTSQALHQLDELIHYISSYDALTGLPNRYLFCDRLHQILSQPQNSQRLIAVLLVGIDDFSSMVHALEHEKSNLLLRSVAKRLAVCVSESDMIAHLKEDEFAVARIEITSFESVINLSENILSTLAKPFLIEGDVIHITASIGIVINDVDDRNGMDQLLQQAYLALYQVRQQGRSQYQFYLPEMNARLQERLMIQNALHGALERNEMMVFYQPLIDLNSGQVTAMEALARWQHPTEGLISPAAFIPIAEANGLIVPIGEWVLRKACAQNRDWQLAGYAPIRISVNLSARQFEQPNLVNIVSRILEETNLDAAYLELEVTESVLMVDMQRSIRTLEQLRALGVALALDDFGTGYSSLNYLKRFPVNMLKIDRSFVQDITSNPDSAAVTNAIIALAKSLRLSITAEGVETQEQLDYLHERGCHEGQGFYFSRPMPADVITPMLRGVVKGDALKDSLYAEEVMAGRQMLQVAIP